MALVEMEAMAEEVKEAAVEALGSSGGAGVEEEAAPTVSGTDTEY